VREIGIGKRRDWREKKGLGRRKEIDVGNVREEGKGEERMRSYGIKSPTAWTFQSMGEDNDCYRICS
jgi:hypothetical protein